MTHDREPARPKVLDRWLARGAVAVVMTLQLVLVNNFAYGARWLAPWFARPVAWRVLDAIIGVTMFVLSGLLMRQAIAGV